jgi:hypothetical protein
MQEEYKDPAPSFSQRAYLIAESLRATTSILFGLYIIVILSISLGIANAYSNPQDVRFFKFWLPYIIIVFSPVIAWYFIRSRRYFQRLKEWKDDYLEQAYILVFDTTVPKGNTSGEKILNLARAVFPELRSDYSDFLPSYTDYIRLYFKKKFGKRQDQIISKSLNYTIGSYSVDLALKTEKGYFIVKDFKDKIVTLEDLMQLVQIIRGKFRDKYRRTYVFRVICVAKEYDQSFKESMVQQMSEELSSNIKLDLLVQEKIGYSVLWVS